MAQGGFDPEIHPESAIVMVHGDFGDGLGSWGATRELIGAGYRTIIVDRPGFGEAIEPNDPFTIAGEAASLLQMTEEVGLQSFHLAGHSYGAIIALEMAISRPQAVRSLHLIEPPLLDLLPENSLVREMDRLVRLIQSQHSTIGDEATTEAFFAMLGADHVPDRLRGTLEWQRLCSYAAWFASNEPAGDYPRGALERLPAALPVGLYTGGRSHPALRAITRTLAKRLERARLTDVPDAGHAVQMAGMAFVEPMLDLVRNADSDWVGESARAADTAREE